MAHIDVDQFSFAPVELAIRELQAGRMIVVVDGEDREHGGDLIIAAEMITPEAINFMAMHGGLICLAMTEERIKELDLHLIGSDNTVFGGRALTSSIDSNAATGISVYDLSQTIKRGVYEAPCAEDFVRRGHIFPLSACDGGVLERRGRAEAAVDLARLAGLSPAAVICEIVDDNGAMVRVPDLMQFCKRHHLLMITVDGLANYRIEVAYEESLEAILDFLPVSLRHQVTELDYLSQE